MIGAFFLCALAAGAWAQVPRTGVPGVDFPIVLATEHGWGKYTYRDDETGYYGGWNHDIIDAVCNELGLKCRTIIDDWNNCVQGRPGGKASVLGQGNQNGWYHAYVGAFPTRDRIHFAKFSMPFINSKTVYIWQKSGGTKFNGATAGTYDFTNAKVGFVSGWSSSPSCVNFCLKDLNERSDSTLKGKVSGYPLKSTNVINNYLHFEDLKNALKIGTEVDGMIADANFNVEAAGAGFNVTQVIPCTCVLGGAGVIGRADNTFIDNVWNKGFDRIMRNGVYKKMCDGAAAKYGAGNVECVTPSYDWSN